MFHGPAAPETSRRTRHRKDAGSVPAPAVSVVLDWRIRLEHRQLDGKCGTKLGRDHANRRGPAPRAVCGDSAVCRLLPRAAAGADRGGDLRPREPEKMDDGAANL